MALPMRQQTRWTDAPEMSERIQISSHMSRSTFDVERHIDMDDESTQELLHPLERGEDGVREVRCRVRGWSSGPVVAGLILLVLLVCLAALLATSRHLRASQSGGVSFALGGNSASSPSIARQTLNGQPFIYVDPPSAAASFQQGMIVILNEGSLDEEYHKVERAHSETGAVRFHHGLEYSHAEGTPVRLTEDSPELEASWSSAVDHREVRFSVAMYVGAQGEQDSDVPDTKIKLNQGCYQFAAGDEVELSSSIGHYEFNMITGVTPAVIGPERECEIHLAYPVKYTHTPVSEVSKMVDATKGFNPTPAPQDISSLDTDGDGQISKKEARVANPEVFARFDCLGKDGDGKLSADEVKDYHTLDTDGDKRLSKAEVGKWCPSRFVFDDMDTNKDGFLDPSEMVGRPDIVFVVKEVDYSRLAEQSGLVLLAGAAVEGALADDLDGVDASQVTAKLTGGLKDRRLRRRLGEGSILEIDVWVDGDNSQLVSNQEQEDKDVHDVLLCTGDVAEQISSCCVTEDDQEKLCANKAVSIAGGADQENEARQVSIFVAAASLGLITLLAFFLFYVYLSRRRSGDGESSLAPSRDGSGWSADVNAIVVPGGGLSKDGNLLPWVQERLRRAADIYEQVNKAKRELGDLRDTSDARALTTYIVTMCEGIRYSARDPRGNRTQKLESQIAADYLRNRGVSASDIITDDLSLDTMGNAYFLRTTHTDIFKARSLLVVTNDFHIDRTRAIFKKIYSLGPFPDGNQNFRLNFEPVRNINIEPHALKKREYWERAQIEEFERVSKQWKDLHDVHAHLFSGEDNRSLPEDQRRLQLPFSFTDMKAAQNNNANTADNNNNDSNNRSSGTASSSQTR